MATEWKLDNLDHAVREIGPDGLESAIMAMLDGKATGRTIVQLTRYQGE